MLSATTIHRLLQKVTQDTIQGEKAEWNACFKEGNLPPPGKRKVPVLYTEADSVYVHLQREGEQKHCELKNAIAYEGWVGKAIELVHNGDLKRWCGGRPSDAEARSDGLSFALFRELDNCGTTGALPALEGPHASRQWVGVLKNMIDPIYRVN